MVVYVEYVFLDNFLIDCMLITLSRKGLKLGVKRWGVILSSLVGASFAVIMPLFKLSLAMGFLLKMPIGLLIVALSGRFRSVKEYARCFYLFLFFTFALGGGVTAIFWGLGLSFDPINYSHGGEIPLFLILITVYAVYRICQRVIKGVYAKKRIVSFSVQCAVKVGGKTFIKSGFIDTGNSLVYKKTDSPIIVCSQRFGNELAREGALKNTFIDFVRISTVSGESKLPVYKIEKFLIYNGGDMNILDNVMIGVSNGELCSGGDFDLLIGPFISEVA